MLSAASAQPMCPQYVFRDEIFIHTRHGPLICHTAGRPPQAVLRHATPPVDRRWPKAYTDDSEGLDIPSSTTVANSWLANNMQHLGGTSKRQAQGLSLQDPGLALSLSPFHINAAESAACVTSAASSWPAASAGGKSKHQE